MLTTALAGMPPTTYRAQRQTPKVLLLNASLTGELTTRDVNTTGLRTALWRCDLGAKLSYLAGSGPSRPEFIPIQDR